MDEYLNQQLDGQIIDGRSHQANGAALFWLLFVGFGIVQGGGVGVDGGGHGEPRSSSSAKTATQGKSRADRVGTLG
jgi:hypothetical protein